LKQSFRIAAKYSGRGDVKVLIQALITVISAFIVDAKT